MSEEQKCGNCKNWDSDMLYCPLYPDEETFEEDTCDDGWEDDNEGGLTEKEEKEIAGDIEAHRIMVEGE